MILSAALLCLSVTSLSAQTLLMVRHGEKSEPWLAEDRLQPLNEDGVRRAARLKDLVMSLDVKAIYTSNTTRTVSTAMPSALALSLRPMVHIACENADSLDSFLAMVRETYQPSDFILVVSHSNIIPQWLSKFRVDASTMTEMGISYDNRYKGYLVDGYDGVWLVNLPFDAGSPHVRYAKMDVY